MSRLSHQSLIDFVLLSSLWGASFMFMRAAAQEFGPVATAGLRVSIAALVLLPVLWWQGQAPALRARLGPALFMGLLSTGLPFSFYAWAVLSISTGLAAILNATVPLFGALVAWVWLKDRPDGRRLLGLAIGMGGVVLLSWGKASFKPGGSGWAILACLCATTCYALAASYTKRYLTGLPALASAAGSLLGGTLGLLPLTILFWPEQSPGVAAWASVIALAVLCTSIAYVIFFRLIARNGPASALTVTFLVPVFAVLYGVLLLGETVTGWMLGCGFIIVLGTALSSGLLRLPAGSIKP